MADRNMKPMHSLEAAVVPVFGRFVIGASGAISSQDLPKGFTVTKTAAKTGRYTVLFADVWNSLRGAAITLQGPPDVAWGAAGIVSFLRNEAVATTKTVDVQFATAVASPLDAELPSGTVVFLTFHLKNSTVW